MIITPHQTCGPLFGFAMTPAGVVHVIDEDHPEAIVVEGRIVDGDGEHIGYGGFVEFWTDEQTLRVRTLDGTYRAVLRRPSLLAQPEGPALAPHFDVRLVLRGLALPLVSKLYLHDEAEANAEDPILQLVEEEHRGKLIAQQGESPRHYVLDYVLQGSDESVFFTIDPLPGDPTHD